MNRAEANFDLVKAQQSQFARAYYEKKDVRVTERLIDDFVECSSAFKTAQETYLEACRNRNTIRGIAFAIKAKGDMLVSLGANLRAELNLTGQNH
jgi:hypothetical protein